MLTRTPCRPRVRRHPFRPGVELLEERALLALFTVTTAVDGETGSGLTLRQALQLANDTPGADVIQFHIAGSAGQVFTIAPFTALPVVTDSVLIDGTSQRAFNGGTVELSGASLDGFGPGLEINAPDCTIQGLVINRFQFGAGILLDGEATGCVVQNNLIGTDATGTATFDVNNSYGVWVRGPDNIIRDNLISGNQYAGVFLTGPSATGNTVAGNFIGTDVSGLAALPNGTGVVIAMGASHNTVGGLTTDPGPLSGPRNLISGNTGPGVDVYQGEGQPPTDNHILGNFIGTDVTGTAPLGNGGDGVFLDGVYGQCVGGPDAGAGNVIAFNGGDGVYIRQAYYYVIGGNQDLQGGGTVALLPPVDNLVRGNFIGTDLTATLALGNTGDGVRVDGSVANSILANAIFTSTGPGIELVNLGNNNQPAPQLTGAALAGGVLQVSWSLDVPEVANVTFRIEFFTSDVGDPAQGQQFLGFVLATTDANGHAEGTALLDGTALRGPFITATATNGRTFDTSAFAGAVVLPVADLAVTETASDAAPGEGAPVTYTVTVTNNGPDPAGGVALANVLPAGLTFLSAHAGQGSYDPTTGTWLVGDLPAGGAAVLAFVALPRPGTGGQTLTAAALVMSADQFDPDPSNNAAQVSVVPVPTALGEPLIEVKPVVIHPGGPVPFITPVVVASPATRPATSPPTEFVSAGGPGVRPEVAGKDKHEWVFLPAGDVGLFLPMALLPDRGATLRALLEGAPRNRSTTPASITGVIFQDTDGDGAWGPGEVPLEGMKVYLDRTGAGDFDMNKPVAVTDSNGQFHFDGLAPGVYTVRVVPHRLYVISAPDEGYAEVTVLPNGTATVTFGCKPKRARPAGDFDSRAVPASDDMQARDDLFVSGRVWEAPDEADAVAPWLGGLALAGVLCGGLSRTEDDREGGSATAR